MIHERSRETSLLIDFLSAAKSGEAFTWNMLIEAAGTPNKDVRPAVLSARRYVQKQHGIVFGSIRGVGLKRLTDDEIAEDQRAGISHVKRTSKKYRSRIACIGDRDGLTRDSTAALAVIEPIWTKIADEAANIRAKIQIATIDGEANIVKIIDAVKKKG